MTIEDSEVISIVKKLRDCLRISCTSGLRQSPGVERSKATQYYNMGSLSIAQPRELSRGPDAQFILKQSLTLRKYPLSPLKSDEAQVQENAAELATKLKDLEVRVERGFRIILARLEGKSD